MLLKQKECLVRTLDLLRLPCLYDPRYFNDNYIVLALPSFVSYVCPSAAVQHVIDRIERLGIISNVYHKGEARDFPRGLGWVYS